MRVKTESRRTAIVNAAAAVFMDNGYDKTTMSDIARHVGGSKATLYGYFPSKADLFLATIQALADENFGAAFGQLSTTGDLRTALRDFGRSMLDVITSDAGLALYRLIVAGSADPDVGPRMYAQGPAQADQTMGSLLQTAIDQGQLRPCDPAVAANHLRGLLESEYIHKRLFGVISAPKPKDIAQAVDRAIDAFLTAYGPV